MTHLTTDQTSDGGAPGMRAALTEVAGQSFASLFRLLKAVRPDRPIHPKGLGLTGELIRTGNPFEPSGVDWLDSTGTDTVEARFSRSVGLPRALPDVLGLAVRACSLDGGKPGSLSGGSADVLFASTGWGIPGRFLLQPRLDVDGATMTTLMPYRGRAGPVVLGLRSISLPPGSLSSGEWVLGLFWARPMGRWRQCGELRLHAGARPCDTSQRFNPLDNLPPGARTYAWTRRLRERSYRTAQRKAPAAVEHPGNILAGTAEGRKTMSTVSQLFNSPAADVWRVLSDGWLYSGWVVGASRIRAVDDAWPRTGARLHHSVGAWPFLINDSTRVVNSEPGRLLELVARGWPMGEAKVVITLEDRGNQCQVTIVEDAIKGPGKLMPKFLRDATIGVRNRETLRRLELMAAGGAGR